MPPAFTASTPAASSSAAATPRLIGATSPIEREIALSRVPAWIAAQRLVDQLVVVGSRELGRRAPRPRTVAVWPMTEIDTGRRTVGTAALTRQLDGRLADAYRGLARRPYEQWANGAVDWLIVAGTRDIERGAMPGVAAAARSPSGVTEVCAVLYDRRLGHPLARFRQRLAPAGLERIPTGIDLDAPFIVLERPFRSGPTPVRLSSGHEPMPDAIRKRPGTGAADALCDVADEREAVATAAILELPPASRFEALADFELGRDSYAEGDFDRAARQFARAAAKRSGAASPVGPGADRAARIDLRDGVGRALARERRQPGRAGAEWREVVDRLLEHDALTIAEPPRLRDGLPDRGQAGSALEGIWRRAMLVAATRLRDSRRCIAVVAHQDAAEQGRADPEPARRRARTVADWLVSVGGLAPAAVSVAEPSAEPPLIGGGGDIRDGWDRRLDLESRPCLAAGSAYRRAADG